MKQSVHSRISAADLETVMSILQVNFVELSERVISYSHLELETADSPGLYYNLSGVGLLTIKDVPAIELHPHTLVIVPSNRSLHIEPKKARPLTGGGNLSRKEYTNDLRGLIAGETEPKLVALWGRFTATYGTIIELFRSFTTPIVERFDASDRLDVRLKAVLRESVEQDIGMDAMTTALFKQIHIILLRRSLSSTNSSMECFSIFNDPNVTRAFAAMISKPGASHSVSSLAKKAGLSRSLFMGRFTETFRKAPMTVLRELRMRQAALMLRSGNLSIDQIAQNVGYASRSSFLRAFRKIHGRDPSNYRKFLPYNAICSTPAVEHLRLYDHRASSQYDTYV